MNADEIIKKLDLQPHPEGGFFRETFRDDIKVDGRSVGTAIFFLLRAGEVSRWHKVDAAEIWHFYAGSPLKLGMAKPDDEATTHILGNNLANNELPQHLIPAGWWQQAQSLGDWTLVGCTVSPGFEFSSFVMAEDSWEPSQK